MDLPHFKYHPNAYQLNIFEEKHGVCSICNQQRDLKYNCSFYSVEEPDYICPWCIANGDAAKKYEGEFNDYCGIEGISADPDGASTTLSHTAIDDICSKTPSYHSWQQEVWLTHCNEPCQFIAYANSKMLEPIFDEIQNDIKDSGYPIDIIQNQLHESGDLMGYLFQCLHCKKHRLHLDCS